MYIYVYVYDFIIYLLCIDLFIYLLTFPTCCHGKAQYKTFFFFEESYMLHVIFPQYRLP